MFGAGGGIGHAVVARFAQSCHYARIHAGSHQQCGGFGPMVSPFTFDLTDENSMADASAPSRAAEHLLQVFKTLIAADGSTLIA